MKVLIVDDDEDGLEFLTMALPRRGFEVFCAHDVASARARLLEGGIDALVCDLSLPDGSGENVLEGASNLPAIRVVLSGSDSAADRERTSKAGFQKHLVKPIDADELTATLRQLEAAQPTLSNR